jgi:formate-dependent nitrite reductase membrane component NrfD
VSYPAGSGPWPEARSYHGQPVVKDPVWTWEIPLYFYTGGVAGASAGLAYLCELRGEQLLARRAWAMALAGITVSPAFLTSDLGRPARFLNMLRMFKVTSPMSVGSWVLAGSGAATGLAAVNAWTGRFPRAARFAKPAAAVLGLPLSTYTAALLANTAIPVWHHARRLLPFVFGSGAALSAGAIGVAVAPPERARAARRLALGAAVLEGPLMELMALRLGKHGHAYRHGAAVASAHLSRGCIVTGAALLYRRGGSSRSAAVAAGALLSVGAIASRWSVFRAGFRSANDPRYVVGSQRELIERGERRGAARTEPTVAPGDPRRGSPATTV